VFLLVFVSTLPLVVPFFLIGDVRVALRMSNAVAIVMLFAAGYLLARYGGYRPLLTAVTMVVVGCGLVAVTVALGG
jgi:VIT1/CCC1 family predicted Fe2+/Mn2+ transporter